jgi:fatty acid-binding protein DegV
MHIAAEAEALEMADRLAAQTGYPREEIILGETGMALAAHGGPGTLGIIVVSR